jgi:integrase
MSDLTELRNIVIYVLAFYAFLRFEEVISIRLSHITFYYDHFKVVIPSAKNDQLRQGNSVLVANIGGKNCPCKLLEKYLSAAKLENNSDMLIFRRIVTHQSNKSLHKEDLPLKYINVLDSFRKSLEKIGLNSAIYGTHSLRAGGSTSAANSGIEDRLFQKHGRWKSTSAKDSYIKESKARLLSVTKSLT